MPHSPSTLGHNRIPVAVLAAPVLTAFSTARQPHHADSIKAHPPGTLHARTQPYHPSSEMAISRNLHTLTYCFTPVPMQANTSTAPMWHSVSSNHPALTQPNKQNPTALHGCTRQLSTRVHIVETGSLFSLCSTATRRSRHCRASRSPTTASPEAHSISVMGLQGESCSRQS